MKYLSSINFSLNSLSFIGIYIHVLMETNSIFTSPILCYMIVLYNCYFDYQVMGIILGLNESALKGSLTPW